MDWTCTVSKDQVELPSLPPLTCRPELRFAVNQTLDWHSLRTDIEVVRRVLGKWRIGEAGGGGGGGVGVGSWVLESSPEFTFAEDFY